MFNQDSGNKGKAPTSDIFAHLHTPQTQSGGVFGQNNENQNKQPTSDIFAHIQTPQAKTPSNPFSGSVFNPTPSNQQPSISFNSAAQAQSQQSPFAAPESQSLMQTSPDASPRSGSQTEPRAFSFLDQQTSPTKKLDAPGQSNSLFSRVSQPSTDSKIQNPTSPSKVNTSQAEGGLFGRVTQPQGDPAASTTNGVGHDSDANARATGPSKGPRKIAQPTLFRAPAKDKPAHTNPFSSLKFPPKSQPTSSSPPMPSVFSPVQSARSVQYPDLSQSTGQGASSPSKPSNTSANTSLQSNTSTHREFGTLPSAPADFTEEEKRQLVIGYRLKALDVGMQKYVGNKPTGPDMDLVQRFYEERKQAILSAGGMPLASLAGSKRNAEGEPHVSEARGKKNKIWNGNGGLGSAEHRDNPLPNGVVSTDSPTKPSGPVHQPSATNMKRKADEDLVRDSAQSAGENNKKARGEEKPHYPTLPPSSPGSHTSSMFKNILDNKTQDAPSDRSKAITDGTDQSSASSESFQPKQASMSSMQPSPSLFAPPSSKPSFTPSSQPPTQLSSSPFSFKPTAGEATSSAPKAPMVKPPTFGNGALPKATGSSPFSIKPTTGNQPPVGAANTTALKPPTFGAGASTDFMSQFGRAANKTAEEEKRKRKAEDFDSDEEDEAAWERRDAEEQRMKKQKLEEEAKVKTARFIPGKGFVFPSHKEDQKSEASQPGPPDSNVSVLDKQQNSHGLVNGHNIFGHLSDVESGAEGSKTGDADDENDESEESDEDEDDEQEQQVEQAAPNSKTPQKPLSSPFAAFSSAPSSKPSSSMAEPTKEDKPLGRSLFDRISKDESGNPVREITKLDPKPASNMFGASSSSSGGFGFKAIDDNFSSTSKSDVFGKLPTSTPSQNAFGTLASSTSPLNVPGSGDSPKGDHTWKADSPIKFGSNGPPAVNVTSPSPSKSPFGALFGAPKVNSTTETPAKPVTSIFSTNSAKSSAVGFGFAISPSKPATNSLAPPSNNASNTTSRATSPGVTTGESANESTADGEDDKVEHHEQLNLTAGGPGEEEEEVLFEVRSKAVTYDVDEKAWTTKGLGPLRVLKHKETGRTRIIMRQDPSGRVVLNTALLSGVKYQDAKNKSVKVPIATGAGKLETYIMKVRDHKQAAELSKILEEYKPSQTK